MVCCTKILLALFVKLMKGCAVLEEELGSHKYVSLSKHMAGKHRGASINVKFNPRTGNIIIIIILFFFLFFFLLLLVINYWIVNFHFKKNIISSSSIIGN